jgi:hypothetical protein
VGDRFSGDEIFHRILASADEEIATGTMELLFSGLAAGFAITLTFVGHAAVTAFYPNNQIIAAVLYPLGFIYIILGRYQLYTENILPPVALVLAHLASLPLLLRVWGLVLFGTSSGPVSARSSSPIRMVSACSRRSDSPQSPRVSGLPNHLIPTTYDAMARRHGPNAYCNGYHRIECGRTRALSVLSLISQGSAGIPSARVSIQQEQYLQPVPFVSDDAPGEPIVSTFPLRVIGIAGLSPRRVGCPSRCDASAVSELPPRIVVPWALISVTKHEVAGLPHFSAAGIARAAASGGPVGLAVPVFSHLMGRLRAHCEIRIAKTDAEQAEQEKDPNHGDDQETSDRVHSRAIITIQMSIMLHASADPA